MPEVSESFNKYILILDSLYSIIEDTSNNVVHNTTGLFAQNVNFYTKTYLIMMCVYLEAYQKEILSSFLECIDSKLATAKLPHNFIRWSVSPKTLIKENDWKFDNYKFEIGQEDIDQFMSGNPHRIVGLFASCGIDIKKYISKDQRDKIYSIVDKRNKIIHYNDDASDITFNDLLEYINRIKDYMCPFDRTVIEAQNS